MNENIQQTQINRILEIIESHEDHFDTINKRFDAVDKRFDTMEERSAERFDILSEQIRQLEKQHGKRLTRLEAIAEQHDKRFTSMETEIRRLVDKVDSMYKWIIGLFLGLMLPMWASIIIAIFLKK